MPFSPRSLWPVPAIYLSFLSAGLSSHILLFVAVRLVLDVLPRGGCQLRRPVGDVTESLAGNKQTNKRVTSVEFELR